MIVILRHSEESCLNRDGGRILRCAQNDEFQRSTTFG